MIKNINDATIVNLIRKGDSSAFGLLYDNYAPLLYGIIFRIVREKTAAEEILEKTILRIWESRTSHDFEKMGFSMWVINIARSFAKQASAEEGATDINQAPDSNMLDLVIAKGLNIKQAAGCLRISVSEALVKLREELKQSTYTN